MYKWKIDIVLHSGKELTVYYEGEENNSGDVAKKRLFAGTLNVFNSFYDDTKTKIIFVKVGEIAAATIYAG